MNIDKFVLNKLCGGKEDAEILSDYEKAVCFIIDKVGYEETMRMPFCVFLTMLDYYDWVAEEEKKAIKK